MPKLEVTLNGTDENPYHKLGLRCNPFTQLAQYGTDAGELKLNELAADPIPDVDYIRRKLMGYFKKEFIEYCCNKFKKGEMVTFVVEW